VHGEMGAEILATIPAAFQILSDVSHMAVTLFTDSVKQGETEELPTEFFKIAQPPKPEPKSEDVDEPMHE